MRLFIKHLATWLLTFYSICAFVQWDLCVLSNMGKNDRLEYIFVTLVFAVLSFFIQKSIEE